MYHFGSGNLIGKPVSSGNSNANPTATTFGTLQDVGIDYDFDIKELYGQNQAAVAVAKAKMKISCKASFATINAKTFADLHWAQALTTGSVLFASNVSVTAATTITATPPNSGVFVDDMGVFYQATGIPLVNVATGPTVGQYSYNAATGVYTFAAADVAAPLFLNFTYTSTTGFTMAVTSQLMGFGPEFQVFLNETYKSKQHNVLLLRCISSKLGFKTKQEDFVIPEMDFMAFQTASGLIFNEYFSE